MGKQIIVPLTDEPAEGAYAVELTQCAGSPPSSHNGRLRWAADTI
jgi:hypothetical protein